MNNFELDLLKQQFSVMQKELNEVLNEMQTTIQAITRTYSIALKVIDERLKKLEGNADSSNVVREDNNGKEI